MEENLKNKLEFTMFFIIIIALLIGGFYYTNYVLNNKGAKKKVEEKEVDLKLNKDEDYFYYKNEAVISEAAEIYYKDIVINLKDQEELTKTLEKENEIYKNNIKHISTELENGNLLSKELVKYDYDDLYSLKFRNYETYQSSKYLSLVVNDYNYSCLDFITFDKTKTYVFNLKTGEYIAEDELLDIYNINMSEIKQQIKQHLESKQNEEQTIKIEETINDLTNYALYIDNYNKLYISYLVKTNEVDYNDTMEVII